MEKYLFSSIKPCANKFPEEILLIDCLSITDLYGLLEIFRNEKILKIFHSARGDISVLNTSVGATFKNIFDVQLAENILSSEKNAISYKNLVRRYFYKSISKEETNSDWNEDSLKRLKYPMLQRM